MSARNTKDVGFTDFRLMRAPADGGPITEIGIGEPLDEFRCSMPGKGQTCVLRTTHERRQFYYELDPIKGKGRELGRINLAVTGLGHWGVAANGRSLVVPSASASAISPNCNSIRIRHVSGNSCDTLLAWI